MRHVSLAIACLIATAAHAAPEGGPLDPSVVPPAGWRRISESVDRGLAWLATQQQPDGSFHTNGPHGTGVSALAVMAFLSAGHAPGEGPYGPTVNRGVDFILRCQGPSGLISSQPQHGHATYHHAIAGVMLGECYGMSEGARAPRLARAIESALRWTEGLQYHGRPRRPQDRGGWRYTSLRRSPAPAADLSVTSWMIMFYRSAKNAEFAVSEQSLDEALGFVERCHHRADGGFRYSPPPLEHRAQRSNWAMTSAGVTTLVLAGKGNDPMTQAGGRWLLKHPMVHYGRVERHADRYHYAAYYSGLAALLLGGDYWSDWYPRLSQQLIGAQYPSGRWPDESGEDQPVAGVYTTSMSVMTLAAPYQLLPIYQR